MHPCMCNWLCGTAAGASPTPSFREHWHPGLCLNPRPQEWESPVLTTAPWWPTGILRGTTLNKNLTWIPGIQGCCRGDCDENNVNSRDYWGLLLPNENNHGRSTLESQYPCDCLQGRASWISSWCFSWSQLNRTNMPSPQCHKEKFWLYNMKIK